MPTTYKAAVFGRTGAGNYGHGLDVALLGHGNIRVVAVSDPDPEGRAAAAKRLGVTNAYADYGELLAKEKPDIVSVCPRWMDAHRPMVLACAEAGVKGVYCEKAFSRTPAECDEMLDAADRSHMAIQVSHQARGDGVIKHTLAMLRDGAIGKLLSIRGRGKEDRRGGGQDLMVLGTHVLDQMRLFAGEVRWVFADIRQDDHPVGPADVKEGDERIGLIAGNSLHAVYGFDHGVRGYFESTAEQEGNSGRRMGLELIGEQGIISLRGGGNRFAYLHTGGMWAPGEATWKRLRVPGWELNADGSARSGGEMMAMANKILVQDLISAIEQKRPPLSSGRDAAMALEMIVGVYAAHRAGAKVELPLKDRRHPLADWK